MDSAEVKLFLTVTLGHWRQVAKTLTKLMYPGNKIGYFYQFIFTCHLIKSDIFINLSFFTGSYPDWPMKIFYFDKRKSSDTMIYGLA